MLHMDCWVGRKEGRKEGWMDGRMDGNLRFHLILKYTLNVVSFRVVACLWSSVLHTVCFGGHGSILIFSVSELEWHQLDNRSFGSGSAAVLFSAGEE